LLGLYIKEFNSLAQAQIGLWLDSNSILNEFEFELEFARILYELSLNMHFIARLELELDSNKHLHKRAKLKILKLNSTRLDYGPTLFHDFLNSLLSTFLSHNLARHASIRICTWLLCAIDPLASMLATFSFHLLTHHSLPLTMGPLLMWVIN
jgi:hypothetical protein